MITPAQIVRYFDKFLTALESGLTNINDNIASIAAAQAAATAAAAAATAAQSTADTASTTATTAQTDAVDAAREAARINSYTNPGSILTASDAGTDATITIANHTRVYPVEGSIDVPDVAITGGAITGLAYSTLYFIYYDDTTLADTTPAFQSTTDAPTAQVGAAAGRHCCGYITTPASGGTTTSGGGTGVPGGTGGGSGDGKYLP